MADHPFPSGLHVNLLGPLVVTLDGRAVQLTGRQVPRLLALLALRNGTPATLDKVIDVIWDEAPPAQAKRVALNLVGRMRQVIGSQWALTRQGAVSLVGVTTDLDRFFALRGDAAERHRKGDDAGERECLSAALRLVRGTPLADWADDPFFDPISTHLQRHIDRSRLRAAQLALDANDHDAANDGADAVLARDPLSQQALGIAMAALAGTGRIHEALTVYQDAKERLAEATGLDPDPALTALYTDILRTDGGAGTDAAPRPKPGPVPRQLPVLDDHVPVHTHERDRALNLLRTTGGASPTIFAVNGPGGIGKSAFTIELAHSLADDFPDGQLFAELHGNTLGKEPADVGRVLSRFLRSLGYDSDPGTDVEESIVHFRSVTADRRILIVLDDVREVTQIRPLLPNGPGCAVITTSRRALSSLRGAEHLELPLLDEVSARNLFRTGVAHPFTPGDEQALEGVLSRCAGLPLALCIVAARFNAAQPGSLPAILDSLTDRGVGLAGFDDGEHSLAATVAGSLKALASAAGGPEAVELFTMLALHPGPAVPVEIAAALVDRPVPAVRHQGELLHRYRLVEQHRTGHFTMHDLVRLFATAEAGRLDPAARDAAEQRMRSAYLAAAVHTYRLYREHMHKPVGRNRLDFVPDLPAPPFDFASLKDADEWFIDELPALADLALAAGESDPRFPGLLFVFLRPPLGDRAGMTSELLMIVSAASALTESVDEPWGVYLHHDLAEMQIALGDDLAAARSLDRAERSARKHGRFAEAVGVKATQVRTLRRLGDLDRALDLADEAIGEARELGLDDIAARAGAYRSYVLELRGEHDAAVEQSAQLVAYTDDPTAGITARKRSAYLINYAFRLVHAGRAVEGLAAAELASTLLADQAYDGTYVYAETLWGQAEAHQALGNDTTADALWKRAAELMLAKNYINPVQYDEILAGRRPVVDPAD
jgi:DNA-binding SARP family transcriptional activator